MSGMITCLLSDHISTPNAVLNMDGADVERDLKDDYVEIIEPTAQAQGKASCLQFRTPSMEIILSNH